MTTGQVMSSFLVMNKPCVIFGLEATCWAEKDRSRKSEVIEIGAVLLRADGGGIEEFSRFVRPVLNPQLSDFCIQLTSIQQVDVDAAEPFEIVFKDFAAWVEKHSARLASWGQYDIDQLQTQCRWSGIDFPKRWGKKHLNLKQLFAQAMNCRPCGMKQALQMLHIPLEGTHHRAIDDARNIAKIAQFLLGKESL